LPDNTSLSSINIPNGELNQALALANLDIDILIFDACNMQTMEVIAEVSDYARFVIGSQDEIKVSGFPYEEILSNWELYNTTVELAKGISNDFLDSYFPSGSQNPHGSIFTFSCSVVDTYKLPDLLEAIDFFIQENPIDWSNLVSVREDCLEFNDPKIDIDLYQFFLTLSDYYPEADLNDIFLALENFFVYNRAFYPSDNMLFLEDRSSELGFAAVWFPDRINEFTNLMPIYDQLTYQKNTGWTNLINRYFEIDTVKK
jgi:hypothetical protein